MRLDSVMQQLWVKTLREQWLMDVQVHSNIFLLQSKFSERATFKIWFVQVEKGDTILDVKKKIAELLEVFPLSLSCHNTREVNQTYLELDLRSNAYKICRSPPTECG